MKTVSALAGAARKYATIGCGIAAAIILVGCGEENPSFQEHVVRAPESVQQEAKVKRDAIERDSHIDSVDDEFAGKTGVVAGPNRTATNVDANSGPDWGAGSENFDGFPLVADSYVQNYTSKVDILWIVDSSGSMNEEQNTLAQKFNSFITGLAGSGQDFQTAITTTDICQDNPSSLNIPLDQRVCPGQGSGSAQFSLRGSFVGDVGQKVLNGSMTDLIARFGRYVKVGVAGSGFEHGLKAAEMAVTKSLNGQNESLVRNDAFLSVIVVSDEEDDGIGLSLVERYSTQSYWDRGLTRFKYTEDDLIRYLSQVKGAGNFSVSGVVGTRNTDGTMCSSPDSLNPEEGTQYIKAAQKTGGIIQSICSTDWSSSLQNIGRDINAQAGQIVLSQVPYSTLAIKVWVDGVLLASANWSYNSGSNSIRFASEAVPANGANVLIKYYVAP